MTSPGVNSSWRAPYLDSDQPLVKPRRRTSYLNDDQSWCKFRMDGPLLGQWPALVKSGRRTSYLDNDQSWCEFRMETPYLDDDQSWCEFRKEDLLPGQWPALMWIRNGGPSTWTMTSPGVNSGWRAPYLDDDQSFMDDFLPGRWPVLVWIPDGGPAPPQPFSWPDLSPPVAGEVEDLLQVVCEPIKTMNYVSKHLGCTALNSLGFLDWDLRHKNNVQYCTDREPVQKNWHFFSNYTYHVSTLVNFTEVMELDRKIQTIDIIKYRSN